MKQGPKILIMNNDAVIRLATRQVLEPAGYEIFESKNGADAIEKIRLHQPALVLLDIDPPDTDELEICRRIKTDPAIGTAYVVILAGLGVDSAPLAADLETSADEVVTRPIPNRELLARIRNILRLKTSEDALRQKEKQLLELISSDATKMDSAREQEKALLVNQALLASEQRYRQLFDESISAMALHEIICDADGIPVNYRFLSVNARFENLTGLREEDLLGKTVLDVLPNTEPTWIERYGRVALSGTPAHFEDFSAELNKYFEVRAYSPEKGKFAVQFFDITERKNAEKKLSEQEKYLRTILETTQDGFWIIDQNGKIEEANAAYVKMSGYSQAELLQLTLEDLDADEKPAEIARHLRRIQANGYENFETRHRRKDGSSYHVELSVSFLPINGGKLFCFCRNVTERTEAQQALRQSEEHFRGIYENLPLGYQSLNTRGVIVNVNKAWLKMLGYTQLEVINREFISLLPVEYQKAFLNRFSLLMAEGRQTQQYELEIFHKNGSRRTLIITGCTDFNENFQSKQTHCILTDITENKQAQETLHLQSTALEATANAIAITNRQGELEWVNPAFETLTGYKLNEVQGKNPSVLKSGQHSEAFYNNLWETILSGKV